VHIILPSDVCTLNLQGHGELDHCMLYYLVSGVIVVYQGFIACYCAPLKQIPVQLHELQIFTWLFTSTSLHFLVKNLGDLSCTYFCHQKMFTKD